MDRLARGLLAAGLIVVLFASTLVISAPADNIRIWIAGVALTVELARTPAQRQRGLSGRDSLAVDRGMLFLFDREGFWGFWMPNMSFPLDIIWFNSSRQAVYIKQDLEPCTPQNCPVFVPPVKAMYVLEVNAGFVNAHRLSLGDVFLILVV